MIKSDQAPKRIQPHQIATLNRFNLRPYPQKYPTLIVRGDGSTYRVWSTEEPQEIVRFPIDVSNMSEMDRTRLLRLVTPEKPLIIKILANDMENRLKRVWYKVLTSKTRMILTKSSAIFRTMTSDKRVNFFSSINKFQKIADKRYLLLNLLLL